MARIGIDIRKWADYGIGVYIRNLVRGLVEAGGHDYTLFHKPGEEPAGLPSGARYRVERSGPYSLREPFSLGAGARRAGLELLHCPHYVTPFRPGCPLVVTIHDLIHLLYPENLPSPAARAYARFFLRRAAKKAAVIFADSETTRSDILEHLPARQEQVVVIHIAVDPRLARPPGGEELARARERYVLDHPYALYVGNIKPHKNLPAAVRAFARFRRAAGRQWRLVIVGSHSVDSELRRAIAVAGVREAVRFLGFIPAEFLPAVYKLAEVFVFPSLYEGFGLPPLEAMAAGTPVVASDRSSMPEVLGDAALLVDPTDEAAMAEAMERACADGELRETLIRRGRERAGRFSWRRAVERTLEGYDAALGAEAARE